MVIFEVSQLMNFWTWIKTLWVGFSRHQSLFRGFWGFTCARSRTKSRQRVAQLCCAVEVFSTRRQVGAFALLLCLSEDLCSLKIFRIKKLAPFVFQQIFEMKGKVQFSFSMGLERVISHVMFAIFGTDMRCFPTKKDHLELLASLCLNR